MGKKFKDLLALNEDDLNIAAKKSKAMKDLEDTMNEEEYEFEFEKEDVHSTYDKELEKEELIEDNYDKKGRRYIKFKDGRFIYMYSKGEEKNMIDKMKDFFKKDTDKRILVTEMKDNFSFKDSFNKILTVFLVISLIFVYFYYIRDSAPAVEQVSSEKNPIFNINKGKEDTNAPISTEVNDKTNTDTNTNTNIDTKTNIDDADNGKDTRNYNEIHDDLAYKIQELNFRETKRVMDYLNLRGNKPALTSTLEGIKREKEGLYVELSNNKSAFEENQKLFNEIEHFAIGSVSKSDELIKSLKGVNKSSLQEVIEKYDKL